MGSAVNQRRSLSFEDIAEVMPDVHRMTAGHRTLARWSLAQICKHLANSFDGSIDGFDLSRHRLKRSFFKRLLLRYTLRFGIPTNYLVDPNIEPSSDLELDEAVNDLTRAIERYLAHNGSLEAHPLFGKMPREMWDRIHRFHCAHHLSFVIPVEE